LSTISYVNIPYEDIQSVCKMRGENARVRTAHQKTENSIYKHNPEMSGFEYK